MEMGLLILILIAIAELFLAGAFIRFYFTVGIPIFRYRVPCSFVANSLPSTERLEQTTSGGAFTAIAFRQLDDSRYAFRERAISGFFKLYYTAIMHGLLEFDRENRQVHVTGFVNWFPVAFVALFVFIVPESSAGTFLVFLVGILVLIYAIQARRFRKIAIAAATDWSAANVDLPTASISTSKRLLEPVETVWKIFMFAAIGIVLVSMALALIGTFTKEWTCREETGDWKCVGGQECYDEAWSRFGAYCQTVSCERAGRTIRCERTDWPMIPIQRMFDFVFPRQPDEPTGRATFRSGISP
ncbi:MAG: hypothetical protein FWC38_04250 [Proteobacteria bacterium]|nr:hypothetical protein [Pseudomonadota bacterium]MCL2307436.1 hypothetical protein [Pseudomonadota bacterium]